MTDSYSSFKALEGDEGSSASSSGSQSGPVKLRRAIIDFERLSQDFGKLLSSMQKISHYRSELTTSHLMDLVSMQMCSALPVRKWYKALMGTLQL